MPVRIRTSIVPRRISHGQISAPVTIYRSTQKANTETR